MVFTSNEAVQSWVGQFPPPIPAVNLTFPLRDGNYLIVNGGSNIQINAHLKLLDKSVPRFQAYRGSAYGIDIIKIDVNDLWENFPLSYELIELRNLVTCAELVIRCAMLRKESRGLHYNIDYPNIDDINWNKDTIIVKNLSDD